MSASTELTDYTSQYTYEFIMARCLAKVPDTIDKRQGSVIYDSLAPACMELANAYLEMQSIINQSMLLTSEGDYLQLKAAEYGEVIEEATCAVRKATFTTQSDEPATLQIGLRFSTISEDTPIYYAISDTFKENGVAVPGCYEMTCETAGSVGNEYLGNIVSVSYISNLKEAIMSDILIPGQDQESDDSLRYKCLEGVGNKGFGGNIADYKAWMDDIDGVGPCQVYPAWNGGGTVKVVFLDSDFNKASETLVTKVGNLLDPDTINGVQVAKGKGLGIAPMGHVVTAVTAEEVEIEVVVSIKLSTGFSENQVSGPLTNAISAYLLDIRKKWGDANELNEYSIGVYMAKIISAGMAITGIDNVSNNVLLNSLNQDIILIENETTQQIPVLGSVTINVI